jgi:hypothetical protein
LADEKPIPVRHIATVVTVIDDTGAETHKPATWGVLPPPKDSCQICGRGHPPADPHNAQSFYYQTVFHSQVGRLPTWADAMAHCDDATRKAWEGELRSGGHWTEPPTGERPVKHHGVEDVTVAKPIEDAFRQAINDD